MSGSAEEAEMYACICAGVDEGTVLAAVDEGAESVRAIGRATRAGTGCGGCHKRIERLIERQCGICPAVANSRRGAPTRSLVNAIA
jgi:NAD(P)H-nitrite reductase large subunit